MQHSAPAPGFYQQQLGGATPGHQHGHVHVHTPGQLLSGPQYQSAAPVPGVQAFPGVHHYLPSPTPGVQQLAAQSKYLHAGVGPAAQHPAFYSSQQPGAGDQSAQLLYPQGSHIPARNAQARAQVLPNQSSQIPVSNIQHLPQYYGAQPGSHGVHQQSPQLTQPQLIKQPAQPKYKLEYRCSPTSGRTYQVVVPLPPSPPPAASNPVQYEWRCDPATGVTFQVPVTQPQPPQQQVPAHAAHGDPQQGIFLAHPQQSSQHQHQFSSQVQQQLHPRAQDILRGITPLTGEATKKMTKVIDFAKKCPVK